MKVLVTGANGMLGRTFKRVVEDYNKTSDATIQLIETSRSNCDVIMDITDAKRVDYVIGLYKPDVVLHCAALTNVDYCETHPQYAYTINSLGTMNVAYACNKHNAKLIAISTDYVFDGKYIGRYGDFPYDSIESANGGVNEYGRSKFAGENIIKEICPNHAIVRLGWLYGYGGNSFVHKMYEAVEKGLNTIDVVDDQFGSPTSAIYVSKMLIELLNMPYVCCTLNMACDGKVSRAEFAKAIFRMLGVNVKVNKIHTYELSSEDRFFALRPSNTALLNDLLAMYDLEMPYWNEALAEFIDEEFKVKCK